MKWTHGCLAWEPLVCICSQFTSQQKEVTFDNGSQWSQVLSGGKDQGIEWPATITFTRKLDDSMATPRWQESSKTERSYPRKESKAQNVFQQLHECNQCYLRKKIWVRTGAFGAICPRWQCGLLRGMSECAAGVSGGGENWLHSASTLQIPFVEDGEGELILWPKLSAMALYFVSVCYFENSVRNSEAICRKRTALPDWKPSECFGAFAALFAQVERCTGGHVLRIPASVPSQFPPLSLARVSSHENPSDLHSRHISMEGKIWQMKKQQRHWEEESSIGAVGGNISLVFTKADSTKNKMQSQGNQAYLSLGESKYFTWGW